jgi:hypothetical protein
MRVQRFSRFCPQIIPLVLCSGKVYYANRRLYSTSRISLSFNRYSKKDVYENSYYIFKTFRQTKIILFTLSKER